MQRIDGKWIVDPTRDADPLPGMNRHTELDLAPSHEAQDYDALQRQRNRDLARSHCGFVPQPPKCHDVMAELKRRIDRIEQIKQINAHWARVVLRSRAQKRRR